MVAWSISKFKDCSTISVIFAIGPCDNLPIILEIKIYGAFGLTSTNKGSSLIEIHLELIGPNWYILTLNMNKDQNNNK